MSAASQPDTDPALPPTNGLCDPTFGAVQTAFAENFESRGDTGAAVAVWHRGKLVVDMWGGWSDHRNCVPWAENSLQLVFSTTKGLTAAAVLSLIDRFGFDLDAPVCAVWPEFAANGKEAITTRHLLSHRSGLAAFAEPISVADCHLPGAAAARLAAQTPEWPVDRHGYHAITFGFLLGEVAARVTGMSLGSYWRKEFGEPLGLDTWIGLPAHEEYRVTRLRNKPATPPSATAESATAATATGASPSGGREAFQTALLTKGSLTRRVFTNPEQNQFNSPELHAAEWPAANGITTARSLATFYGLLGAGDVLSANVLAAARTVQSDGGDLVLLSPTRFGLGYQLGNGENAIPAGGFGHNGAGGSVAFAVPELDLAFAYVMTTMDQLSGVDNRAGALVEATLAATALTAAG